MIKEKYTNRIEEVSLKIVQGKINSVGKKDITKTGLRVYKDSKIGIAGAIGEFDEEMLEKKAIERLKLNISYESKVSENHKEYISIESNLPEGRALINKFESVINKLAKENDDFVFNGKINIAIDSHMLKNSENVDLTYKRRGVDINLDIKEKTSANIFDLGISFETNNFSESEFLQYSNNILRAYRNKIELPERKLPVVFLNNSFQILIKFWDLNGLKFGTGASIFSEYINQKKLSDNFTLYDSRNPEDSKKPFFDAEGVVNDDYRYKLIENGIIKAPFTDKETARIYNLPSTGSALCEYDGVPGVNRWPNIVVKPGKKTAKELLGGDMGIFIDVAAGGDFTADGKFGTPVQVAYLFDGDKFIGRLPELQLNGHLFDFFGNGFRGVSSDTISPSIKEHYMVMDMEVTRL